MKLLPALIFALFPIVAHAATPEALYDSGDYVGAIAAGEALGTGAGFTVAARAALADADSRTKPCLACLLRAEDLARKAISADPSLSDPHLILGVAMGYEARIRGVIWTAWHGYAHASEIELVAATRRNRKNAAAWLALGVWHLVVAHTAAENGIFFPTGAHPELAPKAFARAFGLAPDDISLRYQYALALALTDAPQNRDDVTDTLALIAHLRAHSAYERLEQARAAELAALLVSGDRESLTARVRQYSGYP